MSNETPRALKVGDKVVLKVTERSAVFSTLTSKGMQKYLKGKVAVVNKRGITVNLDADSIQHFKKEYVFMQLTALWGENEIIVVRSTADQRIKGK